MLQTNNKKIETMVRSSITEEFEMAYRKMPKVFSSNAFVKMLRRQFVSEHIISQQHHVNFLLARTERITNRTFEKRVVEKPQLIIEDSKPSPEEAINSAIELLKSAGYKIFKTVTVTEEV